MTVSSERQSAEQRLLAEQIRAFRTRQKRVLADVAAELGWTTSTLSRVLNGKTGMSVRQERSLRNLLDTDGLTGRQDDLVRLISTLRPPQLGAASQILQIMQNLGNLEN